MPHQVVGRREVKVHLPRELGLERLGLQVDHDVPAEAEVIEERVEVKVVTADLEVEVFRDECEADA